MTDRTGRQIDPPTSMTAGSSGARRPMAIALLWLLVASVFVAQNIVSRLTLHRPLEWLPVFWYELEYWSVFALCTPCFIFMATRFPLERANLRRSAIAHTLAGGVFALLQPIAAAGLNYLTLLAVGSPVSQGQPTFAAMASHQYPVLAIIALWKYAVVIGVVNAFDYHRRLREQEVRHARLERQFALAQLSALRVQLQPHFLFNALHSAAVLALGQAPRAHRFLVQLGELFRDMLQSTRDDEVPMTEEFDLLDRYLAIERVRFDGRLTVRFEISEEAETVMVPSLILQPLVENAIVHAFAAHSTARALIVRARVVASRTIVEVEDDGPGLPDDWVFEAAAHTGLRNVQARVDLVNGAPTPLVFSNLHPTGLHVQLLLPARKREAAAA
jgi:two-component system, LytTR family, sensor kinase